MIALEILVGDQAHDIDDRQYADRAGIFEEVDPLGEAQGQDENDGASSDQKLALHIPVDTEIGAVQRGERSVELVADNDQKCNASAE